jgi:SH3-like domain-containing protein
MKRYLVLLLAVALVFGRVFAQDNNQTITLNDATPGIDVTVSTPQGAAGAVSLQLSGASVTIQDGSGSRVFQVADKRVHGLELHFAPGAAPHTITVERLPGVQEAYVSIVSQAEMNLPIGMTQTAGPALAVGQEFDTTLSAATPNANLSVSIPANTVGQLAATFPGSSASAAVLDQAGMSIATLDAAQIDGLSLTLDGGEYHISLTSRNSAAATVAGISLGSALVAALPSAVMSAPATTDTVALAQPNCAIQIAQSSINLRSGPGTGYSILDYAYRAENLPVSGTNPEQNWLLVASSQGTGAWMDKGLGVLSGDCSQLQTYNIPYRAAPQAQIIVQAVPGSSGAVPSVSQPPSAPSGHGDDHHEDHEEHDGGDD